MTYLYMYLEDFDRKLHPATFFRLEFPLLLFYTNFVQILSRQFLSSFWTIFRIYLIIKSAFCKSVVQKMNKIITEFLSNLGLDTEESAIYSTLLEKGPQTVLEISRNSGIDRTGVYRLLEKLHQAGIIEEIVDENRKIYSAADINTLEFLVKERENQIRRLHESLPFIDKIISSRKSTHQPGTKVLFYRGKDGIRQQVWNTLRADKVCLGYTYRKLGELIGDYYIKWLDEWVEPKLIFRDIYSDDFLKSQKVQTIHPHIPEGFFQSRYISFDILNVNHQYDIYNDVVSIYNWHEGEIFGVEIYNQKIADLQRQMFEIVWKIAEEK